MAEMIKIKSTAADGFEFGAYHADAGLAVAMTARQGANVDTAVADLTACVNYLKGKGPVFVVGYCFGGSMTWQAAGRIEGIAAPSSYYGGYMADLTPKCPTICHFGRKDAHIPADEIKATLQAAQPQVAVYIYEKSGHGFNNDDRPDFRPGRRRPGPQAYHRAVRGQRRSLIAMTNDRKMQLASECPGSNNRTGCYL